MKTTNTPPPKKTIKTQYCTSATADFEEMTWTFEMPEKCIVAAGEFAIVDKILYDQLIDSVKELQNHCLELNMQSIYISNVSVTLNKLDNGQT